MKNKPDPTRLRDVDARNKTQHPTMLPEKYFIMGKEYRPCAYVAMVLSRTLSNYSKKRVEPRFSLRENTWRKYVNTTFPQMIAHIESTFEEGMTWDNYGRDGWCLSYLTPLKEFDMSIEDNMYQGFNLLNMIARWPGGTGYSAHSLVCGVDMPPANARHDALGNCYKINGRWAIE